MYSLAHLAGIPIAFDEEEQKFSLTDDLVCQNCEHVQLSEIIPTLLNKSLRYPEAVYTCHRSLALRQHTEQNLRPEDLSYDIYVLPHSLLGIEYVKTHVYYNPNIDKVAAIVEVFVGELTIIMQKNAPKDELDFDTHVSEVYSVQVNAGEKAAIPGGFMFTFVNATFGSIVFSVVWRGEPKLNYSDIAREQGLAYFLISKNAKTEIVANPRYRTKPEVVAASANKFPINHERISSVPLYEATVNMYEDLLQVLA